MSRIRYEVLFQTTTNPAQQRVRVHDHEHGARYAVELAHGTATAVTVMRFDPATGWDIAGVIRRYPSILVEGSWIGLYDDLRTDSQKEQDARAHPAPGPAPTPERRGRVSGMFAAVPAVRFLGGVRS